MCFSLLSVQGPLGMVTSQEFSSVVLVLWGTELQAPLATRTGDSRAIVCVDHVHPLALLRPQGSIGPGQICLLNLGCTSLSECQGRAYDSIKVQYKMAFSSAGDGKVGEWENDASIPGKSYNRLLPL